MHDKVFLSPNTSGSNTKEDSDGKESSLQGPESSNQATRSAQQEAWREEVRQEVQQEGFEETASPGNPQGRFRARQSGGVIAMAARKKTAKKRKSAKKAGKKRASRKAVLAKLVRKPMRELSAKVVLLNDAIAVKVSKELERKGLVYGPRKPTAADRAFMAREKKAAAKEKRLASLARARAARQQKKGAFIGPIRDLEAARQHELLRQAGVAGY
jgi:hypothetical protein